MVWGRDSLELVFFIRKIAKDIFIVTSDKSKNSVSAYKEITRVEQNAPVASRRPL